LDRSFAGQCRTNVASISRFWSTPRRSHGRRLGNSRNRLHDGPTALPNRCEARSGSERSTRACVVLRHGRKLVCIDVGSDCGTHRRSPRWWWKMVAESSGLQQAPVAFGDVGEAGRSGNKRRPHLRWPGAIEGFHQEPHASPIEAVSVRGVAVMACLPRR
jgi:hypothetical protein